MNDVERKSIEHDVRYVFNDLEYIEKALTHSSFANETDEDVPHNERLEYLGDAVLELAVSEHLFVNFPDVREGYLTRMRAKLVSKPTLAQLAREIRLDEHLRLGRGEESQGGRNRSALLADAFEAVLGAIFMDGGFEAARAWVHAIFTPLWPQSAAMARVKDFKSRLQELTQRRDRERPIYTLTGSHGPEHDKVFEVTLLLPDGREVHAQGGSMKKAEQHAARTALEMLEREDAESDDS